MWQKRVEKFILVVVSSIKKFWNHTHKRESSYQISLSWCEQKPNQKAS